MQTRTTRRRFILTTPLGVSALTAVAAGSHNVAEAAPNSNASFAELTATEAVPLLRSGDLSAERYAQVLLEQCRKHRALNAFIPAGRTAGFGGRSHGDPQYRHSSRLVSIA